MEEKVLVLEKNHLEDVVIHQEGEDNEKRIS